MATTFGQSSGPITADTVVSSRAGAVLHGILLNSVAATATIQLFDDVTTTAPSNPIGGVWTPGAVTVPIMVQCPIVVNRGLVVKIAVAAANISAIGRF